MRENAVSDPHLEKQQQLTMRKNPSKTAEGYKRSPKTIGKRK